MESNCNQHEEDWGGTKEEYIFLSYWIKVVTKKRMKNDTELQDGKEIILDWKKKVNSLLKFSTDA